MDRERPRWGRILAGIAVIVFLALPCLAAAVVLSIAGNAYFRSDPVGEGRAPGTLRFDTVPERYVIALGAKSKGPLGIFDGMTRTERRQRYRIHDGDASEARCTIAHPDGSTARVRGDRQVVSETVGTRYATVGEFDGRRGATTVKCRFDPPKDLLGTVTETPLMVHPLDSLMRYLTWGLFAAMLVFAGLGTLLILWGTVWRAARA